MQSIFNSPLLKLKVACLSVVVCADLFKHESSVKDFLYFAEKKAKFRGIFRGKFAEKSADFAGFSGKKVKFRRIFRGKFLEKSAEISGGNFAKKQSVKNSRFRWIFFAKFR